MNNYILISPGELSMIIAYAYNFGIAQNRGALNVYIYRIKMLKRYETWTDIFCFTIHISNNMNDKIELYQNYMHILMFSLTNRP